MKIHIKFLKFSGFELVEWSMLITPSQIERSSFNEVKFTKSLPSSAERYANMEKIAASRNPQLAASLSSPGAVGNQWKLILKKWATTWFELAFFP